MFIDSYGVMELDFSQMALEVSYHSYLLVTHLTTQEHCCHAPLHAYWYMDVMRSSRLFRVSLFLENGSILMIWGCFSIVSNVIRSNYCCRRHTMHGNMVFSWDSIFPTPQQSWCLLECSAKTVIFCDDVHSPHHLSCLVHKGLTFEMLMLLSSVYLFNELIWKTTQTAYIVVRIVLWTHLILTT